MSASRVCPCGAQKRKKIKEEQDVQKKFKTDTFFENLGTCDFTDGACSSQELPACDGAPRFSHEPDCSVDDEKCFSDLPSTLAMNGKTPISALQELMAAKGLRLPVYIEEGFGTSFKCTVQAANVVATGIASSKKAAKHESAKNALEKLGVSTPTPATRTQIIVLERSAPLLQTPFRNYVGDLNEFASKKGLQYPDYTFINWTMSGFVQKCSFLGREMLGLGTNKKDAKQDAAKKMLQLVNTLDHETLPKTLVIEKTKFEIADDREKIISLYSNLSLSGGQSCTANADFFKAIPEIVTSQEDSVETLKSKLSKYSVNYTIEDIQNVPPAVCSKIKGTNLVFIGSGKNREEAVRSVLEDMLMVAKSGCSLSTNDLMSFD